MNMPRVNGAPLLNRRQLLGRGFGTTVALGGVPALLAACGDDEEETPQPRAEPAVDTRPPADGEAIVGDVLDFALTSDEWEGAFGFVSMRLHEGVVDGESVWFVRTDASDETFARREKLVFAPRIASLSRDGLSGELRPGRPAQLIARTRCMTSSSGNGPNHPACATPLRSNRMAAGCPLIPKCAHDSKLAS